MRAKRCRMCCEGKERLERYLLPIDLRMLLFCKVNGSRMGCLGDCQHIFPSRSDPLAHTGVCGLPCQRFRRPSAPGSS